MANLEASRQASDQQANLPLAGPPAETIGPGQSAQAAMSPHAQPDPALGIPENYRLKRILSRRSATTTCEVIDQRSGEVRIMKRLALGVLRSIDELERFEREAALMAGLDHQGLPQLLASWRSEGPEGLVLTLICTRIPGVSLAERLAAGWRPDQAQLREIARQTLGLLKILHANGILHRDLKPGNLLLDEQGRLGLVDFGAARHQLRGSATVAGTFGYLAPEQFYGRSLPESDLYGLGATLVHLLTGRHPAELPRDELRLRWREYAEADPDLLDWIDGLLDPDPDLRPESAIEALELLERPGSVKLQPRFEPGPWPRVERYRVGRRLVLTALGQDGGSLLRSGLTLNLPPLGLLGLSLLAARLNPDWQILAVLFGIICFFVLTGTTILLLVDGIRRTQIWLGPDRVHIFARAVQPQKYATAPLPDNLRVPTGRSYLPGVLKLDQVTGVRIEQSLQLPGGEARLRKPFWRWLSRIGACSIQIQVEHLPNCTGIPALQGLSLAEALWVQREILGYLLRHQSEDVARQALLQLQNNQRLQQALDESV